MKMNFWICLYIHRNNKFLILLCGHFNNKWILFSHMGVVYSESCWRYFEIMYYKYFKSWGIKFFFFCICINIHGKSKLIWSFQTSMVRHSHSSLFPFFFFFFGFNFVSRDKKITVYLESQKNMFFIHFLLTGDLWCFFPVPF